MLARVFFCFGAKSTNQLHFVFLSHLRGKWDNVSMEQLIETLKSIGIPDSEINRIREYYGNDVDGLREYVTYMRLVLDDRHEYV